MSVTRGHILITGATGLVGGYLSATLSASGNRVTAVSRRALHKGDHLCIDLTDANSVKDVAEKLLSVDTIIHCAAIAHREQPPNGYSIADFNTKISTNLINAFAGREIKWIFLSSISVYGDWHSDLSIPITRSPNPADSYGAGKLCDEELFLAHYDDVSILRLMPVYDSVNTNDIRKRVFLPYTKLKIKVIPSPLYSLCNLKEVLATVEHCLNWRRGQRIIQVGDSTPLSQSQLAQWFSGWSVPVPQVLFKIMIFILPKKFSGLNNLRFLLKKLGLNNIYSIGYVEII